MNEKSRGRSLLIVDDDDAFRQTLVLEFKERGYTVFEASTLENAKCAIESGCAFDFAILDLRVRGELGFRLLKPLLSANSSCRAVMLTGYPTTATTVESMRGGAVNCILKPSNIELIEQALWIEGVADGFDLSKTDGESSRLAQYEYELIEFVLAQCDWNITQAARRLGLHRQSLQRKLRKYPAAATFVGMEAGDDLEDDAADHTN
ncbi:MAG: response regulator [Silvanigrellales bacterium]|jgi:two-component system response regulator RegA|nr:response regulator [Silvanigrellales bacterium]